MGSGSMMRIGAMGRRLGRQLKLGAIVAALGGCSFFIPDYVHTEWREQPTGPSLASPNSPAAAETADTMVGLALSGGGSRAAVFGAAVIEALEKAGWGARLTHISSVSGGGFAASYYLANPPGACEAATVERCNERYFNDFQSAMRENFWLRTIVRQMGTPGRITSQTRRTLSLKESLDARFLNGARFGDLPERPLLLVNAARYDDGRRFTFSTLAIPDDDLGDPVLKRDALRTSSFSQPGCARPTPKEMPVSLAIATSASFPGAFGPVTIEAPSACDGDGTHFWHLGDGGIIDNSGVDILEELIIRSTQTTAPFKRAVIFAVDAARPWGAEEMFREPDIRLWTSRPTIFFDTAVQRGRALREVLWERLGAEIGVEIVIVPIRYEDARIAAWPESCGETAPPDLAGAAYERLSAVPTSLAISDCDADLVSAAAKDVVARGLDDHAERLDAWFEPEPGAL